jgi:diguanylate cyclase (GGDEF)-like protein
MSAVAVNPQNRVRVLLADDSRVIRKAVTNILGEAFEILEAEDGAQAWDQLLPDERIEVLITDIDMPNVDGYTLICRVRAHELPRIRELPIIVITGAQDDTTKERAYACGATDFITKPIDTVQLLARARAHARLDQTTRKLAEAEIALEQQSAVDPVTQLASKRFLLQRSEQDIAYAKRHEAELSIVRLDIDHFTEILMTHGEALRAPLLQWLAEALKKSLRAEDSAARLSGSEFAVIAHGAGRMEAAVLCERIRANVAAQPFTHAGKSVPVTVSLGLTTLGRDPGDTIEAMLETAAQRLTLAKAAGGNRLGVGYEEELPAPEESVMEEPDIEAALALLANGDGGKLLPYLPELLRRVLPLLEYGHEQLDLGYNLDLESLKRRLDEL